MIGIIGAMELEITRLREQLADKKEEQISGVRFTRGRLCDKEVVLAVCGIGKTFAALCAQTMILRYNPEMLIKAAKREIGILSGDPAREEYSILRTHVYAADGVKEFR